MTTPDAAAVERLLAAPRCSERLIAIVGAFEGSHIGASLQRAARQLGIKAIAFDTADAARGARLLRAFLWRCADRRPPYLRSFCNKVAVSCRTSPPELLVATGAAPLTAPLLRDLRASGVRCVNYSTDDPWNPMTRARWYLLALPEYDAIYTTRRSNVKDLQELGCRNVRYLPFGYDETLCEVAEVVPGCTDLDVLFVGGADHDRVAFMTEFIQSGLSTALVGGYWDRFAEMRRYALGLKPPDSVAALTLAAKVNLCLVRRANRDGHVMRSFEIAALGGCLVAEDTDEHREIFGKEGDCVWYFRTPSEAAQRAKWLLARPAERRRLAAAARARITGGENRYQDRLLSMLEGHPG